MNDENSLKFSVFGVKGDIHEVTIKREVGNMKNLSAFCSCGEATDTDFCEHRFSILEGDESVLTTTNVDDLNVLKEWVRGSDIEYAMIDLSRAKTDLRLVKDRVDACRKKLAQRMLD